MDTWNNYLKYKQIDSRLPIITVMGHVDHGKTTLVETLLGNSHINVELTSKEPGGISQNINSYKLPYAILVDTPGHEIFSSLRATLMNISDIILLVIACDDGVNSQTVDIIKKAKENSTFLVVINKIDRNPKEKAFTSIYGRLASNGIYVDEQGGNTLTSNISAKNKIGIEELIENIKIQWELMENNKTDRNSYAIGHIMDCYLKTGLGYVTSIIMKAGQLKKGDSIIADGEIHKIKVIYDKNQKQLPFCAVDDIVLLTGINKPILPGTSFASVDSKLNEEQIEKLMEQSKRSIRNFNSDNPDIFILQTNSIVKLETLVNTLESRGKIIETYVSHMVKDSTIKLAKSTKAKMILWGDYDSNIIKNLKNEGIDFVCHEIIYNILESLEKPEEVKEEKEILGNALIKKVFVINGTMIAGCGVSDGKVSIGNKCIIKRQDVEMAIGRITSMKREKDNIREAVKNSECGLIIQIEEVLDKSYDKFQVSDEIIAFVTK